LKVLQYMAAGLPVVANPIGVHCDMVVHGQTGMLASTPAEWANAIGQLAADPGLRQRMGYTGRQLVERQYSVQRWAPEFARLIALVANPAGGREAPRPGVPPDQVDRREVAVAADQG
ncbi:unnamed protein product, partial [marine sediment metagenome]